MLHPIHTFPDDKGNLSTFLSQKGALQLFSDIKYSAAEAETAHDL